MILTYFFHQTLNRCLSYITSNEKNIIKFGLWRSTVTLSNSNLKAVKVTRIKGGDYKNPFYVFW